MKRILFKIFAGCLIVFSAKAQTPAAEKKMIGPMPAYRGFQANYYYPFLQILSADAKQTRAGTGFIGKKYPLIIFLHGIGERTTSYPSMPSMGTGNLDDLYATSLPSLLRYTTSPLYNKRYAQPGSTDSTSFLYLCPQVWQGADFIWPSYPYYMIRYALDSLSDILDTTRIYITGLSFGGGGTLLAVQDSTIRKYCAAALSNCAGYNFVNGYARDWKGVADWGGFLMLCHSTDDNVTTSGARYSNEANDSIMKYKGITILQYKRYTTGQHTIWDRAYDPSVAATNWPLSNAQTTNFLLNMHSQFLMFSTRGRRKVVP